MLVKTRVYPPLQTCRIGPGDFFFKLPCDKGMNQVISGNSLKRCWEDFCLGRCAFPAGYLIGFCFGGVVIPLIFPKVPQSSQTEFSGFPRNTPSTWFHPGPFRTGIITSEKKIVGDPQLESCWWSWWSAFRGLQGSPSLASLDH